METQADLRDFIKYCLGYINLTRKQGFSTRQKEAVELNQKYLNLEGLLNGDLDGNIGETIDLKTYYAYAPKDVPEELREDYRREKELAEKIEDVYNKHRNDQYRKQVLLHFGYFEIEFPIIEEEAAQEEKEQSQAQEILFQEEEGLQERLTKKEKHPIFSMPVRIEKENDGKYTLYTVDTEFQINLGRLQTVLEENSFYQLLEEVGKYEADERLMLPLSDMAIFPETWKKISSYLKLGKAVFDESSFSLDEMRLVVGPKANFFLSEDLRKLFDFPEEDFNSTALATWMSDEDLAVEDSTEGEDQFSGLYFPFAYDKYQLQILPLLKNKAFIVEGPPGTGKSQTISNLLCHLAATGKKVLFVSQKAQALKVVKDRLKSLKIQYLFGYIPNPSSAQLSEQDEFDGIAPQLLAMTSHISKLKDGSYRANRGGAGVKLEQAAEEMQALRQSMNDAIATQREIYTLIQELRTLKGYVMTITDLEAFKASFNSETWRQIKSLKKQTEELSVMMKRYGSSMLKKEFDDQFTGLDFEKGKYSEAVKKILGDVAETAYDRHSAMGRKLNIMARNFRLREARKALPREIIDAIDKALSTDVSRKDAVAQLNPLLTYCEFFESKEQLEAFTKKLQQSLEQCGVSGDEFQIIDDTITSTPAIGLDEVKEKIIRVQEIAHRLDELKVDDPQEIAYELKSVLSDSGERVSLYLQNILNRNILQKSQSVAVTQKIRRLSKSLGKSKTAFKTFDRIRRDSDNFNTILDLIPIWIMELDDASRIIPLESGIFDYVILDEASQCNVAYTLPAMFRSRKAIFVGDSEQMRDNTIMFKSNKSFDELAKRYGIPEELQIKSTGATVQSVLDIAYLRGFQSRALTYHYRSPQELIGFSNEYFYKPKGKELISLNSNYLTFKETNRVMIVHPVQVNWQEEIADPVNVAEAKEILALFKELRSDGRYKDKSVGILTFFNAQATYIRELFEKEGFKEEKNDYLVSIIDGIQGDEKDIIIYSFVIKKPEQKRMYQPLTGEGGDVQRDINMGRVNVAFSRARLQIHCFTSLPVEQVPDGIWIKKFLTYVQEGGEVDFYSSELKEFDSYFEQEFHALMRTKLGKQYMIQNQVESCGFKLDFVITNCKNGHKLVVECDGPTHFKDELDEAMGVYVENDQERQAVLEAAGWNFYRLRYSDWIDADFSKENLVRDIIQQLQ